MFASVLRLDIGERRHGDYFLQVFSQSKNFRQNYPLTYISYFSVMEKDQQGMLTQLEVLDAQGVVLGDQAAATVRDVVAAVVVVIHVVSVQCGHVSRRNHRGLAAAAALEPEVAMEQNTKALAIAALGVMYFKQIFKMGHLISQKGFC